MNRTRTITLTALAMLAFAANSVLCRLALRETGIDPGSFTALRIASGAFTLGAIVWLRGGRVRGNWLAALALFIYAAAFSFAYTGLTAATGALLLFGAVQITMVGVAIAGGERVRRWEGVGLLLAFAGLVTLLLPGLSAPPLTRAALMLAAGAAWGLYSLRGRGVADPTGVTAGNFLRAVPPALLFGAATHGAWDTRGAAYAVASGAFASGLGYAVWYTALRGLRATPAAVVQLSVPVIVALGGLALLDEPLSARLVLASVAVLGGIGLVIAQRGT